MIKYFHAACALFAALYFAAPAPAAPIRVTVDGGTVVARREEPLRYGVCMNYLMDADDCDPQRKHPIRESLKKLGVKAVRWNEGEIGDKMIWSIPPFEKPDVHATHLRTPGTVHYNWRVDRDGKLKHPVMELDEAIAIARDLELELFIIVGIDAIWVAEPAVRGTDTAGRTDPVGEVITPMTDFPWATEGKTAREMIVAGTGDLAAYLAREAADVPVFLEIGNENYLGDANWKPEAYAAIVNALSRRDGDQGLERVRPRQPSEGTGHRLTQGSLLLRVPGHGRPGAADRVAGQQPPRGSGGLPGTEGLPRRGDPAGVPVRGDGPGGHPPGLRPGRRSARAEARRTAVARLPAAAVLAHRPPVRGAVTF